jgi:L-lactate dehydrogenase complex protein LldF
MKSPVLYKISGKIGRTAQKTFLGGDSIERVPGPISGWTDTRDLPPLAEKPFRELWKEGI